MGCFETDSKNPEPDTAVEPSTVPEPDNTTETETSTGTEQEPGCYPEVIDQDEDGYSEEEDCDDNDASLNLDDIDDDGYSSCDGDCDDNDASLNLNDIDGDGYSSCDGDCLDDNLSIHSSQSEEYGDGTDNDCDGLIDCEDSDCAQISGCFEDCGDTQDNDGDSLIDCDDDECWGTSSCSTGKTLIQKGGHVQVTVDDPHGDTFDTLTLLIQNFEGELRIPTGPNSFTACEWSMGSFTNTTGLNWGGPAYMPVGTRPSFTIESGCGYSSSAFLGNALIVPGSGPQITTLFPVNYSAFFWYQVSNTQTWDNVSAVYTYGWSGDIVENFKLELP